MKPGADKAAPASSRRVAPGRARSPLGQQVVAASAIAAVAFATLTWKAAFADPAAASLKQATMARTTASESATSTAESARPSGPASDAASNAVAPHDAPTALARQLKELSTATEQLQQQSRATDERLHQLEADLASLREQLDKSRSAQLKAHRRAEALARHLRTARAAAQTQAIQQAQAPRVLSVDSWAGRPSVSVQVGAEVRFFAEGDVVANALLRKADPATQRVEFVSAAGAGLPTHGPMEQRQ